MAESAIIRFQTESGSCYEVDLTRELIRRLIGSRPPTARQGGDGRWQTYMAVSPIQVGASVAIVWHINVVEGIDVGRSTITSRVVEVGAISEVPSARPTGAES